MRESETVEGVLKDARKEMDDIKIKQFTGSSSVKIVENTSINTWDLNQTVNFSGAHPSHFFSFYFIADTQLAPYATFHPTIQVDGADYILGSSGTSGFNSQNSITQFDNAYLDTDLIVGAEQLKKATGCRLLAFNTNTVSINIKVKMTVLCNDSGTVLAEYRQAF